MGTTGWIIAIGVVVALYFLMRRVGGEETAVAEGMHGSGGHVEHSADARQGGGDAASEAEREEPAAGASSGGPRRRGGCC